MKDILKLMPVAIAVLLVFGTFSCRSRTKVAERTPEPDAYRYIWDFTMPSVQKKDHPANGQPEDDIYMGVSEKPVQQGQGRSLLQLSDASFSEVVPDMDLEPLTEQPAPETDAGAQQLQDTDNHSTAVEGKGKHWFFSKFGLLLGGGAFTALLMLMLKKAGRRNRISLWAHRNAASARALLIPGQAALLFSGVYAGKHLGDLGIAGSDATALALSGLGLAGVLLYPFKHITKGPLAYSAKKHRLFAGFLTAAGLCAAINMGAADGVPDLLVASAGDGDYLAGKIFLTLLALTGFLMLGYVLAIITCELICLDLVVLAFLVGGGGAALIIYLLYLALRAIWGNRARSLPVETQIRGKS